MSVSHHSPARGRAGDPALWLSGATNDVLTSVAAVVDREGEPRLHLAEMKASRRFAADGELISDQRRTTT
jgi:hypothetical protein